MRFDNIVGQEKALNILKNAIKSDRIAQAYIFHGSSGVGKLLTAFSFAKALNCLDSDTDIRPCNSCNSCKKIDKFIHPDIKFYFPIPNYDMDDDGVIKSKTEWEHCQKYVETKMTAPWKNYNFEKVTAIRIEQIRALQKDISMSRHEGRKKVYIFEDFDSLSVGATNAFLKTLEEPPPDTHFIFTVQSISKLLPTILSRCITVEFHPISTDKIETFLLNKLYAEASKARLYARLSNGNFEKAITLYHDDNLSTMDATINFLEIALAHDDIAFLDWVEMYFAKNTKNADLFKDFVQYLYLWMSDLQMLTSAPDKVVFVNQIGLLKNFATKNTLFSEKTPKVLLELDDYLQKYHGNVNQKLILSQIYASFTKL